VSEKNNLLLLYTLVMVNPNGTRQEILIDAPIGKVRNVARGIKRKPGRRLAVIHCNKEFGLEVLDGLAYEE
jgi:hypothetical protein